MLSKWQNAYLELKDFISQNKTEIDIQDRSISIEKSLRSEFWGLFNVIKRAYMEQNFPDMFNEASLLSENYRILEQDISEILMLDTESSKSQINNFLHDPIGVLVSGLFEQTLDLLREKIDLSTFEFNASQEITSSFGSLFKHGYEKWVSFSLLKLLKADISFRVPLLDPDVGKRFELLASVHQGSVPALERDKPPLIEHKPFNIFTVPDLLIHSSKLNRYIAFRSDITDAIMEEVNANPKKEWYLIDSLLNSGIHESLSNWGSGLTVIYLADSPNDISLVADAKKFCRPDLMLECAEQLDWYKGDKVRCIKRHHEALKPRLGTYIVSREKVPDAVYGHFDNDVQILVAGYNSLKLNPIINALESLSE